MYIYIYTYYKYILYNIYIYYINIFELQVPVNSIDPPLHWDPRLLQARAVSGSFFVNIADGITDRVLEVNKSHGGSFKAGIVSIRLTVLVVYATILVKMPLLYIID